MLHWHMRQASYTALKQSLGVDAEIIGMGAFTISAIICLHQIALFSFGRQVP